MRQQKTIPPLSFGHVLGIIILPPLLNYFSKLALLESVSIVLAYYTKHVHDSGLRIDLLLLFHQRPRLALDILVRTNQSPSSMVRLVLSFMLKKHVIIDPKEQLKCLPPPRLLEVSDILGNWAAVCCWQVQTRTILKLDFESTPMNVCWQVQTTILKLDFESTPMNASSPPSHHPLT